MTGVCIFLTIWLIVSIVSGIARGLFKTVLACIGLVLSLAIGLVLSPHVSKVLIENTNIDEKMEQKIARELKSGEVGEEVTKSVQISFIESLPIDEDVKDVIMDSCGDSDVYNALGATGIYDYVPKSLAVFIINISVFVILSMMFRIFFCFLEKSLNEVDKIPIIKEMNHLAGGVLGFAEAVLGMWVFFIILSVMSSGEFYRQLIADINANPLFGVLYRNNILQDIVVDLGRILFP